MLKNSENIRHKFPDPELVSLHRCLPAVNPKIFYVYKDIKQKEQLLLAFIHDFNQEWWAAAAVPGVCFKWFIDCPSPDKWHLCSVESEPFINDDSKHCFSLHIKAGVMDTRPHVSRHDVTWDLFLFVLAQWRRRRRRTCRSTQPITGSSLRFTMNDLIRHQQVVTEAERGKRGVFDFLTAAERRSGGCTSCRQWLFIPPSDLHTNTHTHTLTNKTQTHTCARIHTSAQTDTHKL